MNHSEPNGKPRKRSKRRKSKWQQMLQQIAAAMRQMGQRGMAVLRNTRLSRSSRRLRLVELLPLGGRRFVALVRVDDREFLVGGFGDSVVLLTRLYSGNPVPLLSDTGRCELGQGTNLQ